NLARGLKASRLAARPWPPHRALQGSMRQVEPSAAPLLYGLPQVPAEALDAAAGFLHLLRLHRIGDAERRPPAKPPALHDGHAFSLQQLGDKILVGRDRLAGRRRLANGAGAGGIDVEGALGLGAFDAARLVEHRDTQITALLEDLVVLRDEVLRSVERL